MAEVNSSVFCTNCAFFNSCKRNNVHMSFDDASTHETCNAPQNIRPTYMSDGSDKYISTPSIINKYNNCKWFVAKGQPMDLNGLISKHNKDPQAHPDMREDLTEVKLRISEETQKLQYQLDQHEQDTNNPHQVTKAQLGLSNVDNTSDINKPISTATQTALDVLSARDVEIGAEINKSRTIEAKLNEDITLEKQRASGAEATIAGNLSQVALNLANEQSRAQNAEAALSGQIAGVNSNLDLTNETLRTTSNSLAEEVRRAKQEESEIRSAIEVTESRITETSQNALAAAKAYTDARETVVNDKILAAKSEDQQYTRDYVNTKITDVIKPADDAVLTEAKGYVDKTIRDLKSQYIDVFNEQDVETANGYTDAKVGTLKTYVDGAFKETMTSLIAAGKNQAIESSKQWTDQKNSETNTRITNVDSGIRSDFAAADSALDAKITQARNDADGAVRTLTQRVDQSFQDMGTLVETKATKATTLEGYGITDAYTKSEIDTKQSLIDGAFEAIDLKKADKVTLDQKVTELTNSIDQVDAKANTKADASSVYTKTEIDGKVSTINNKIETADNTLSQRLDKLEGDNTVDGSVAKSIKTAIDSLDVAPSAVENQFVTDVSEVDGKISVSRNFVTKAQVDLGNVDNTSDADKPISTAANIRFKSAEDKLAIIEGEDNVAGSIKKALKDAKAYTDSVAINPGSVVQTALDDISNTLAAHRVDTDNPHQVTKEQVGLGNVDNTKDIDKPISAATQAALDNLDSAKADKATTLEGYGITDSYTKSETYTKGEIDNKVTNVSADLHTNYLPLTGNKTIDKDVKFDEGITVKDSANGDDSVKITASKISKTDATNNTININYPTESGDLALTKHVNAAKAQVTAVTDDHATRISALENAVPTSITDSVKSTSVSTDRDVPNNYAVNEALKLKAGKTDTENALALKADANSVYTKEATDLLLADKADKATTNQAIATKADESSVASRLALKANSSDVYTQSEINTKLSSKANSSDVYSITQMDNLLGNKATVSDLSAKADATSVYTKTETDDLLDNKANVDDVAAGLALKADVTALNAAIADKVTTDTLNNKVSELTDSINTKANSDNVYTKSEVYTKTETDARIGSVYRPKGSVESQANLPSSGMTVGDVYNVLDTGANYVWTESGWDKLSETVDISGKQDISTAVTHPELTSVGNAGTPVYVAANGSVTACTVDTTTGGSTGSTSLITSGAVKAGLDTKANSADVYTTDQVYTKNQVDTITEELSTKIDNRYTKAETSTLLDGKVNVGYSYSKSETDNLLGTKAPINTVYTKEETDDLLDLKANSADVYRKEQVDAAVAVKANTDTTYSKDEVDALLSDKVTNSGLVTALATKANVGVSYTKVEANSLLDQKANVETTATKTEVSNGLALKANTSDVYNKGQVDSKITELNTSITDGDTQTLSDSKSYTDAKIKAIKDRHYLIETISADSNNAYYIKDFTSNNIDLSGRSGTVLIYIPEVLTEITDGSREFILNITNWDYSTNGNTLGIRTIAGDGNVTFRSGGLIDASNNIIIEKSDFSIKFQEFNNFKFTVDEIGTGDTVNNKKIALNMDQIVITDPNDSTKYYKIVVVNNELKLRSFDYNN